MLGIVQVVEQAKSIAGLGGLSFQLLILPIWRLPIPPGMYSI
jgi:hypothetical protein